jgi:hypothetical protein
MCIIFWLWHHQHGALNRHHDRIAEILQKAAGRSAYPELPDIEGEIEKKQRSIMSFISQQINNPAKPDATGSKPPSVV